MQKNSSALFYKGVDLYGSRRPLPPEYPLFRVFIVRMKLVSFLLQAPLDFDADVVSKQLQYTGMLETVKIRQAGYPCRIPINVSRL